MSTHGEHARADTSPTDAPKDVHHTDVLSSGEAADYYTSLCRAVGQNANPTFLAQLQSGTVVIQFDNGYLGNQGILPIMDTLRRVAIQALLLPKCALSTDDCVALCDAFAAHPTLERIDLRGNSVTVTGAKKILMLVGRNTKITEVELDASTPKYAAIQQQLARNRREPLSLDKCLVCGSAVQYASQDDTERRVLSALLDLYRPMDYAISVVEFEALLRLLRCSSEHGRGLLFLCSGRCVDELANLVYAGARCVLKACHFHVEYTLPRPQFLRAETQRLIADVAARHLELDSFEAPSSLSGKTGTSAAKRGTVDHIKTEPVSAFFDDCIDGDARSVCTVCGKVAPTLSVGPSLLLEHLAKDVQDGAPLGPSAMSRLIRVFVEHAQMRPCSRKCTKQVERYALFGLGGVVRRQPTGSAPLLSSLGVALESTTTDFTVVDFNRERVDSTNEEETVCARGVASAVSDIDSATVDPYLIFAVGRKLRRQADTTLGVDLQAACEAVCLIGCLEGDEADLFCSGPGSQAAGALRQCPTRADYCSWDSWSAQQVSHGDSDAVASLLRAAFSHRRSGFFQVDGPHNNSTFDNVRAALWTFRRQRRAVLTVMKFSLRWLTLADGVIPDTCPPKGGFYTCVKVVGQCVVENEFRLIVQGFFGPAAGHHGYFYVSKYMFNTTAKEGAYMFVDGAALFATEAASTSLSEVQADNRRPAGHAVASSEAVKAVGVMARCQDAVTLLLRALHDSPLLAPAQASGLRKLLVSLPLSAAALVDERDAEVIRDASAVGRLLQRCLAHHLLPSQLLFALSELVGADGVAWMLEVGTAKSTLRSGANTVVALEAQSSLAPACYSLSDSSTSLRPVIDWQVTKKASQDTTQSPPLPPGHGAVPQRVQSAASVAASSSRQNNTGEEGVGAQKRQPKVPNPPPVKPRKTSDKRSPSETPGGQRRPTPRQRGSGSRPASPASRDEEGGLRGAARDMKVEDPRQQFLTQLWATERLQCQSPQCSAREEGVWAPPRHGPAAGIGAAQSELASTGTHGDNSIAPEHLHQRWAAMRLCKLADASVSDGTAPADVVITSLEVFIIGDAFAIYDSERCGTLVALSRLADHPLLRAFPFPSGCDTLVHHPMRPREVLVFSDTLWAVWDACEQSVIAGPFGLSCHEQFRRLPREFLTGIDGAIPVYGTPFVLLFKQERFVLFDLDRACCVTEVRHLRSDPPAPPLRTRQTGPADVDTLNQHEFSSLPELILEAKLATLLSTAPLAALPLMPSNTSISSSSLSPAEGVSAAAQVFTRSGHVLSVAFRLARQGVASQPQPAARPFLAESPCGWGTSPFRGVPLCFQQFTTVGAWAACRSVVHTVAAGHEEMGEITFFDPRSLVDDVSQRERTIREGHHGSCVSANTGDDSRSTEANMPRLSTTLVQRSAEGSPKETEDSSLRLFTPLTARGQSQLLLAEEAALLGTVDPQRSGGTRAAPADSGATTPAMVTLHLGNLCEEAFCGVVLLLDTGALNATVLPLAPVKAVVESSLDENGVIFQRRGQVTVSAPVSCGTWSQCHVARHWRLRFVTPLPAGLGIVRVLWLRTHWRTLEAPLEVLQPLELCGDQIAVDIDAPRVLTDEPEALLVGAQGARGSRATTDVFELCGSRAWFSRSTVLPLLSSAAAPPDGTAPCLVFCGDQFVEVNVASGDVAGRRACTLRTHPAFAALPRPFSAGFDAVLYPPRAACDDVVVLISHGWQLHWNLGLGQAEGQMVRCTEGYLKGLPVEVSRIESVCNVWTPCEASVHSQESSAGVRSCSLLVVFSLQTRDGAETQALQWSLVDQRVERGPQRLADWPELRHKSLFNASLECVFISPGGPTHVFSGGLYYTSGRQGGAETGLELRGPARLHALWHRVGWYLPHFEAPRHGASLTVDLLGRTRAIVGLKLSSAFADGSRWQIAFSDDHVRWENVAVTHHQSTADTETIWRPSDVLGCGHRFWRLSTDGGQLDGDCRYSSLSFLVLPMSRPHDRPERVALTGTCLVPLETLLQQPNSQHKVALEAGSEVNSLVPAAYRATHPGMPTRVHHVTIDYGSASPVLLTGFCCEVTQRAGQGGVMWTVLCADDDSDANAWEVCSVARTSHALVRLEWLGRRPRRFWCLEMCAGSRGGSMLVGQMVLQRYDGPLLRPATVSTSSSTNNDESPSPDPQFAVLFAPLRGGDTEAVAASTGRRGICLSSATGSALDIEASDRAPAMALAGFDMRCASATCNSAMLVLQQSRDGTAWIEVARTLWVHSGTSRCSANTAVTSCRSTGSVSAAPLWRVQVLHSDDEQGVLIIHSLRLVTAKPGLYTEFRTRSDGGRASLMTASAPDVLAPRDVSTLNLPAPRAINAVRATLPPCSVYQVERLGLDGSTWEAVTVLDNSSVSHSRTVSRGWASLVASMAWRLRSLTFVLHGSSVLPSAFAVSAANGGHNAQCADVCWSAFTSLRPVRVELRHLPGMLMTSGGFTEVEPIRLLCAGSDDPPLRPRTVLRYAASQSFLPEGPSVLWHFRSPTALHRLVLIVQVTGDTAAAVSSPLAEMYHDRQTEPKDSATVVVETGANGVDFVGLAEVALLPLCAGEKLPKHVFPVSLSWDPSNVSCAALEQLFWRVRFSHLPANLTLNVVRAEWFVLEGAPAANNVAPDCVASVSATSNAFSLWKLDGFNGEAAFCAACRRGLDEAKSLESKLRDPGDCSREAETASVVLAKSKRFHQFIIKLAKNTSPGIPQLPESPLYASGAERFRDLQYFLQQSGRAYPGSRLDELALLVGQPLPLRDLKYSTKTSNWFYPTFAVQGSVSEPFYGIARTHACFSVLWSLSFDLQRDRDLCGHPEVSDISPHVASPLIAVHIPQKEWQAAKSFPDLPLLYHAGFTGCPVTVVFALNEVPFSEAFNLQIPDAKPLPTAFPFSVFPGVNFVRRMAVSACPAPVFDQLKLLFPSTVLDSEVVVVFTAPSLQSRTAKVRFTLPATDVTLGLPFVSMEALHVEFTLTSPSVEDSPFTMKNLATLAQPLTPRPESASFSASLSGSEAGAATLLTVLPANASAVETGSLSGTSSMASPTGRRKTRRHTVKAAHTSVSSAVCRIHMVSCGARCRITTLSVLSASTSHELVSDDVSLSVLAEMPTQPHARPRLELTCESRSGCVPVTVLGRHGATLSELSFQCTSSADVSYGLRRFVTSPILHVEALLSLPYGAVFPCSLTVGCGERLSFADLGQMNVQMTNGTLHDLMLLLRWLFVDGRAFTAEFSPEEEAWLRQMPLTLSLSLSLSHATRVVRGEGSLIYGGGSSAHNVRLTANTGGWRLSCTTQQLTVGELVLKTAIEPTAGDPETPVSFTLDGSYASTPTTSKRTTVTATQGPARHVRCTVRGRAALLGEGSACTLTAEIAHDATFATAQTECFDLTVEDTSSHTHLRGAVQVALREAVLLPLICNALEQHPLVASLIAAGLPFRLSSQHLFAQCREATPVRRIAVCFRGVFLGNWFDVVVPADQLHASARANVPLCESLAAEVVEQCAGSLWATYANLVGRTTRSSTPVHDGQAASSTRHVTATDQGTFLSRWVEKECEIIDRVPLA